MKQLSFAGILAIAFAAPLAAQHVSPYSTMQSRTIKALSDQQIADLRAGRGMGLALAAELNGYPGPLHVIELAADLDLSPAQRQRMTALFASMKVETAALGERLIAEETVLDRLFASRSITPGTLTVATNKIGLTQAALRAAHLKYHLATVDVLNPAQVHRYAQLRGYHAAHPAKEHKPRH